MTRETIARYEIKSEIGRGGMATVYLAYDPNFRRNVAIKLVSINLHENVIFRERFEREAHLIARVEHPAIVPVHDYGEQDGQLYLVMRHMSGGPLTNKIKEKTLSLAYASQIIAQVAPALDAVHAQGVVHRDLKPGNILLDGFGNPAIADFGIAHLTVATADLTGSAIIGTPSYMSPEQVRSDANLDGRSDVYALGVILFEMLTGKGPFHAATPLSVALKHLTDPVPSILSFDPDLPPELEFILNKAMAKDRELRYSTASELAQELQATIGTFQDNRTPASVPIRVTNNAGIPTEVDVTGDSLSGKSSSSASKVNTNQSKSQTNTDQSQKLTGAKLPKPKAWRMLQIAALGGLALLLFVFCSSIGLFGTWAGFSSFFSKKNPTPQPTDTSASSVQAVVLYADDFSDPLSGWPTIQDTQGGYGYLQDGYHIYVNEINAVFWAKTNRQDDNISIYTDAKPISESLNGYYGLLCRIQDDQNFYYFVIRSNGDYNIGKYKNAEFQPLFSEVWRQNNVIDQGGQTNRLQADCSGNRFRFYANNVLLGEVIDDDFTSGFSGLVAAALDTPHFEVVFNNFLITKAGQ